MAVKAVHLNLVRGPGNEAKRGQGKIRQPTDHCAAAEEDASSPQSVA
jgi:hypothetical protein